MNLQITKITVITMATTKEKVRERVIELLDDIRPLLEKRYRVGVYIRLVKRNDQTFYCKGYNS